VLSLCDDSWFIHPSQRAAGEAAVRDAMAAAKAADALQDALEQQQRAGRRPAEAAVAAAAAMRARAAANWLRPAMVDGARVRRLAAVEPALLWLLAEVEGSADPDVTLLKWALHPELGPRLATGAAAGAGASSSSDWLQRLAPLPELVRDVYTRARVADVLSQGFMSG
jgi:hypothetical protein